LIQFYANLTLCIWIIYFFIFTIFYKILNTPFFEYNIFGKQYNINLNNLAYFDVISILEVSTYNCVNFLLRLKNLNIYLFYSIHLYNIYLLLFIILYVYCLKSIKILITINTKYSLVK
jgi:hypothetical protein